MSYGSTFFRIRIAAITALTFLFMACGGEEDALKRYAYGDDQVEIASSYYTYDSDTNLYSIYLSSIPYSGLSDEPASFIYISVSSSLMNHGYLDLMDMPENINEYFLSILIRHNNTQLLYQAVKTPDSYEASILTDGVNDGLIGISKNSSYFDIMLNMTETEGYKILCFYNDEIDAQ